MSLQMVPCWRAVCDHEGGCMSQANGGIPELTQAEAVDIAEYEGWETVGRTRCPLHRDDPETPW